MPLADALAKRADRSLLASATGGGVLTEQQIRLIAFIKGIKPMTATEARVETAGPGRSRFLPHDDAGYRHRAWTSNAAPGRNYVVHVAVEGYLPHNQPVEAQRGEGEVALTMDMKARDPGQPRGARQHPLRTGQQQPRTGVPPLNWTAWPNSSWPIRTCGWRSAGTPMTKPRTSTTLQLSEAPRQGRAGVSGAARSGPRTPPGQGLRGPTAAGAQ
jgi:hypothetical protein